MAYGLYDGSLASIPGLGGVLQQRKINEQQTLGQLEQVKGVMALSQAVKAQQEQEQIKAILSEGGDINTTIPKLARVGPTGMKAALELAQSHSLQAKMAKEQREQAFYSPENRAKYMTPGAVTAPATPVDDDGNVNPGVQGAPQFDFGKFLEAGASQGVVDPEKYANHLAQREQAKINAQSAAQARKDALEARLYDIETRSQDRAATNAQRAADAEAARELRRELAQMVQANRQPPQLQIYESDAGPVQVGRDGTARPIMGADGQPLRSGKTIGKALPVSASKALLENSQNLRQAERALAMIEGKMVGGATGDKSATGWKGYLPEAMLQRLDPGGISTRAEIGDLGSMVIHDRSGAAVTAAEFPRLRPFIPLVTDDPAAAKKKLERFVSVYRDIVEETTDFYRSSGFNVPAGALRGSPDATNRRVEVNY